LTLVEKGGGLWEWETSERREREREGVKGMNMIEELHMHV
jgi:hypothetical protein